MGYYTKLEADLLLNEEAPLELITKLCSGDMWEELAQAKFGNIPSMYSVEEEPELPIEHLFGKSKRWTQIFSATTIDSLTRVLHIECEIKAYDEIYELLFDWLKPFIIAGTWRTKGEDSDEWFYETI